MSKILITGNGFDLFHHLPTKYGHFMAIMLTIEKNRFSEEVSFNDLFGKVFKDKFPNDYDSILGNYNTEKIRFDKNSLINFKTNLELNSWYNYFKGVLEIETWIDFENEINFVLENLVKIFNELKSKNDFNYYSKVKLKIFSDLSYFGFIESDNGDYVILKKEFLDTKNMRVKEFDIFKKISDSLNQFIQIFNNYLISIVDVFYKNIDLKMNIPLNLIDEIFTFNYTPTIEKLYDFNSSNVVYLHGKTDADDKVQNLVLGVNEIPSELRKTKMYDFAKYYQKINKKSNHKFIEIPKVKTSELDETIFYIIGHSLDESDKDYIFDLFTYLEFDLKEKSKICVFYFDKNDLQNKLKNLFNIVERKNIVELEKNKRLYFVELNEQNIKIEFERKTYSYEPIFDFR